jgi:hypothetical protein
MARSSGRRILAVAGVLGLLQERIGADPLAESLELDVKFKAVGDGASAITELSFEPLVTRRHFLPLGERRPPSVVVRKEARQVPRVFDGDFLAFGKCGGGGQTRFLSAYKGLEPQHT